MIRHHEPEPDSDACAHFDALITLIEAYEAKHYAVAPTHTTTAAGVTNKPQRPDVTDT